MSLNVNASSNTTHGISTVYHGAQSRRITERNEQSADTSQARVVRASSDVINRLDNERKQQSYFNSGVNKHHQRAIAAYQSHAIEERRSEVKMMFGVDLYA